MSRRRLRMVCDSDEEDEEPQPPPPPIIYEDIDDDIILDDIETEFQTVTLNSTNPTPSSSNYSTTNRYGSRVDEQIPLDISDDDEENVFVSGASNASSSANANGGFVVSESPVNGVLERLGLRLKSEWLDSCLRGLQSSVMGFQMLDDSAKAKLCLEQFLLSDMNYCGAGVLPPEVHTLHLVDLKGPFVLQVDEIVNISCPLRRRYQTAAAGKGRCLKLSMTDGVQRVFGMEYRPINDLHVFAPAGLKVAVCNVNIRHGLLILVPEVLQVLGGSVEELEAARQRLVIEINKPPRGKRNKNIPPLSARATLAAWPPPNNAVPGTVDRNANVNMTPQHASTQGTAGSNPSSETHRQATAAPQGRNNTRPNLSSAEEQNEVPRHADMPAQGTAGSNPSSETHRQATAAPQGRNNTRPNLSSAEEHNEVPRHADMPANIPSHDAQQGNEFGNDRHREGFGVPTRSTAELSSLPEVQPVQVIKHSREIRQVTPPDIPDNHVSWEDVNVSVSRHNDEPNGSSTLPMDADEILMMDELQGHFMLSRNEDIPFTYLASLSEKCMAIADEASVVRGKIKCFLTGVKGFQYKHRATYELRVFIDDGSLISEILIDHKVVLNVIGCSPQEVTIALESPETEPLMKDKIKQFRIFLINFEGIMLVEMNKASPLPVAVEMNQGCAATDACFLLRRLQSFDSRTQTNMMNPICLSP